MSDAPASLPESEDPFEILGVEPETDEVSLRRAYVRLIKVYRPDHHPEAFARVRKAFEHARALLQSWAVMRWDDDDDDDDDDRGEYAHKAEGTATTREGEVSAQIVAAWRGFEEGTSGPELLLSLQEPWDDMRLAMQRFLVADATEAGAREQVLASLARGVPVADWLTALMEHEELRPLLGEDALAWPVLRQQQHRYGAGHLMQRRLHEHMLRGRLDLAVAEVLDDVYVRDAEDLGILTWAGREVLAVAAWADLPDLERLERRYRVETVDDFEFLSAEDHHAAASALSETWRAWLREFPSMRALRRFIVLAPVLGAYELLPVMDEVSLDFRARAGTFVACLFRLSEISPELLERFILAVTSLGWPEESTPLAVVDLAGIDNALRNMDVGLIRRTREPIYEETIRPLLTRAVVLGGLSPEALVAHLEQKTHKLLRLRIFKELIHEDRALAAVAWCRRLADFGVA